MQANGIHVEDSLATVAGSAAHGDGGETRVGGKTCDSALSCYLRMRYESGEYHNAVFRDGRLETRTKAVPDVARTDLRLLALQNPHGFFM